jgi:hypothetical protein
MRVRGCWSHIAQRLDHHFWMCCLGLGVGWAWRGETTGTLEPLVNMSGITYLDLSLNSIGGMSSLLSVAIAIDLVVDGHLGWRPGMRWLDGFCVVIRRVSVCGCALFGAAMGDGVSVGQFAIAGSLDPIRSLTGLMFLKFAANAVVGTLVCLVVDCVECARQLIACGASLSVQP